MFNFGECVQNPPPQKKKTRLEPIERSCHSFTQMILPQFLQEKISKSKKILGTPCSSWKLFIIKQFWTYADHTPEILHRYQKNTIFQRSHLFQTTSKHREASLALQLKKLNSISIFLGKPHPNHPTYSFSNNHGCGKLPIWRLSSSSKALFSTSSSQRKSKPTLNHIWKKKQNTFEEKTAPSPHLLTWFELRCADPNLEGAIPSGSLQPFRSGAPAIQQPSDSKTI